VAVDPIGSRWGNQEELLAALVELVSELGVLTAKAWFDVKGSLEPMRIERPWATDPAPVEPSSPEEIAAFFTFTTRPWAPTSTATDR
jgi:hypothetical protein